MGIPEWLKHVPALSDEEFAELDRRMLARQVEADEIEARSWSGDC